ncbi:hypothetical protein LCGC14_1396900 [marine sediment metagenome]|uniref:Uncharacterized protein n=1 Tax=marine sediment metagenome TaxID=412755 RepID=A0A0F9JYJ5_9ZZZZ|nr:hypothetical protein [Pricia sp.]
MISDEKCVEYPKTIIVDFDGTICGFAFPDTGSPEPGVKEALDKLHNNGFKIIVHSVRTSTNWGMLAAIKHEQIIFKYMKEHDLYFDEILSNGVYNKPIAAAYIDDRGVPYRGNWEETVKDALKIASK